MATEQYVSAVDADTTSELSETFEVTLDEFTAKKKEFDASKRATRRWKLLKNVCIAVRRTSLTPDESELLKLLGNTKKAGVAADKGAISSEGSSLDSEGHIDFSGRLEPVSRTSARNRLRSSINLRRSSLSATEAAFLNSLVEAEDIEEEALCTTVRVLETDELYKVDQSVHSAASTLSTCDDSRLDLDMSRHSNIDTFMHRICEDPSEDVSEDEKDDLPGAPNIDTSMHRICEGQSEDVVSDDKEDSLHDTPKEETDDDSGPCLINASRSTEARCDAQQKRERGLEDTTMRREMWKDRPGSSFNASKSKKKTEELPQKVASQKLASESKAINANTNSLMSYFESIMAHAIKDDDMTMPTTSSEEGEDGEEQTTVRMTPPTIRFSILGTSPDDAFHHVLSPPLMDTIARHMPYTVQEDNFWLKYSLARDGASMDVLLSYVRSSSNTVIAIETTEGEVFGSFTATAWRHKGNQYYGSGESFLWRLRDSRCTPCESLLDRVDLESNVEVFKWSGKNRNVQLANPKKIVVGGGEPDDEINRRLAGCGEVVNKDKEEEECLLAWHSTATCRAAHRENAPLLTVLAYVGQATSLRYPTWKFGR